MLRLFILAAIVFIFAANSTANAETLVLVNDVSQSMTSLEQDIEFQSYLKILSGDLRHAMSSTHVEIVLFGEGAASVSSGSVDDAIQVLQVLSKFDLRKEYMMNVNITGSATCIGKALQYVLDNEKNWEHPIVVDISGDGIDTCRQAYDLNKIKNDLLARDIKINSLPMGDAGLVSWYDKNVTTGFQIPAYGIDEFEEAMYEKLTAEVSYLEQTP